MKMPLTIPCHMQLALRRNVVLLAGFGTLLVPTLHKLSIQLWSLKEQGHGPLFF